MSGITGSLGSNVCSVVLCSSSVTGVVLRQWSSVVDGTVAEYERVLVLGVSVGIGRAGSVVAGLRVIGVPLSSGLS